LVAEDDLLGRQLQRHQPAVERDELVEERSLDVQARRADDDDRPLDLHDQRLVRL
jgi:hypothetical protein